MQIKNLTDTELVYNIKNDNNTKQSLEELSNRHSGIFYKIASKYVNNSGQSNLSIDKELILDSRDYIIFESAQNFNETKGTKFSTFLGNQTRFFCLNHINYNKKYGFNYSIDQIQDDSGVCLEDESENFSNKLKEKINEESLKHVIKILKDEKDERIWMIFKMRYFDGEGNKVVPWRNIHKKIKTKNKIKNKKTQYITMQGCINLHDKAIEKIKNKIKEINE